MYYAGILFPSTMKKAFYSFTSFTRTEKTGIAVLLIALLILVFVFITMPYWTKQSNNTTDQNELANAWKAFREKQKDADNATTEKDVMPENTLFSFDPNTLDSSGFRRLGLQEKTTCMLLNWRRKGKVFYKREDLKPLYSLSAAEYERLAPYIMIAGTETVENNFSDTHRYPREPELTSVNLNRADSATLVRLKGIGPTLAHKITERRKALGGFLRYEQLLEVYKFPDSTFMQLREKLIIDPQLVTKIKLNMCTITQLAAHPYIGEKMGQNILLLREGLGGRFENVEQLRQVPLMNAENYRKIAPYFVIE